MRRTTSLALPLLATALLSFAAFYTTNAQTFSEWSQPVNLGPGVNSPDFDG